MGASRTQQPVEFIRLNGEAIRTTSWSEPEPGHFRLVAIVRGTGDAYALATLLDQVPLHLEIPGQDTMPVEIHGLERRESGEAPAVVTRFVINLVAANAIADPASTGSQRSVEDRLAALEREVSILRKLVETLANRR